jgi:sec-independent protein translocase protein TatA
MFSGIGPWEILLVFLVVLLLFGAKRIPEIAKGLGKGITEFKRGMQDVKDEIETTIDSSPAASQSASAEPADAPSPNANQAGAAQNQPSDTEAGKPTA